MGNKEEKKIVVPEAEESMEVSGDSLRNEEGANGIKISIEKT